MVIGGSGHVGNYLVPRLVRGARGGQPDSRRPRSLRRRRVVVGSEVEQILVDRAAEDPDGTFGQRVAALEAEVVVDMICFTPAAS